MSLSITQTRPVGQVPPWPDRSLEFATTALRTSLRYYTGDELDRHIARRIAEQVLKAAEAGKAGQS